MRPVLVLDVVGLTSRLLAHAPRLTALGERGARAPLTTVLPAVTCPAQATLLTGTLPTAHGAVGNGWLDPDTSEVRNWMQSNRLVKGEKLYETARARFPGIRVAKLFWWFNQGAAVDLALTPKPWYHADGKKSFDVYAEPQSFGDELKAELGAFPFFEFWGPRSGLGSSRWIADAARVTLERHAPGLTLVYLPHLDYAHQRHGPADPRSLAAVRQVDALCGELIDTADRLGAATVVCSEYGITAVDRPVHVNRRLRESGLLAVRDGPQGELLDVFGSRAFAVAEHQVAHVYVQREADLGAARAALAELPGVERVLGREEQRAVGLAHPRAGALVAVAEPGAWFTYYHWLDDARAPDFARTIDIHRKTGFDPCELFVDPALSFPRVRVARRLAQKLLGFRYVLDVVPLDARLVRGSHGRPPETAEDGPVFLASVPFGEAPGLAGPDPSAGSSSHSSAGSVAMTSFKARVLRMLSGPA